MVCPNCSSDSIYVMDTMTGSDGKIYRRRKCLDCKGNFRTVETILKNNAESIKAYADAVESKSPFLKTANDKRRAQQNDSSKR